MRPASHKTVWARANRHRPVCAPMDGDRYRLANPQLIKASNAGVKPEAEMPLPPRLVALRKSQARAGREFSCHQQAQRHLPEIKVPMLPQTHPLGTGEHVVQLDRAQVRDEATQPVERSRVVSREALLEPCGALRIRVRGRKAHVGLCRPRLRRAGPCPSQVREVLVRVRRELPPWPHHLSAYGAFGGQSVIFPRAALPVALDVLSDVDIVACDGIYRVFQVLPLYCVPLLAIVVAQCGRLSPSQPAGRFP